MQHREINETVAIASAYEAMVNLNEERESVKIKYFPFKDENFKIEKKKVHPINKSKAWSLVTISSPSFTIVIHPADQDGVNEILSGDMDEYHFTDEQSKKWKVVKRSAIIRFEGIGNSQIVEVPISTLKLFI